VASLAREFLKRENLKLPPNHLSLAKMLSGANAFEISDIEEEEAEGPQPGDRNVTMLHWIAWFAGLSFLFFNVVPTKNFVLVEPVEFEPMLE
jgi:hypothetical protein